ncbi:MAG: hypothetical protein IPJ00_13820 [Saprospirales bacterium]|nr:hypothetical protein [Saprospirales bacterium]
MTLITMILMIAAIALVWTAIVAFGFRAHKNLLISYLQSFTGALFVFSGAVKAIDPLGTAYKMEQYFTQFEYTLQGTWFSFFAPIFPKLSDASATFSVVMITFEIVLGVMLLIGARPKVSAWLFFLLVVFFTILTGFTFLTGYVPAEVNFFEFGKWGAYQASNMKVTDCGCFGDFMKLEPKISFMKDLVLLVPAFIFLFASKQMHRILTPLTRSAIVWITTIGTVIYCLSNYVWNLPDVDFRPFREGRNIAEIKMQEEEAANNVKTVSYILTNKESGEVINLPYEDYMKKFADYPKEKWSFEPIKTEPAIPATKISEFDIQDEDGNSMTEDILAEPGYSIMIVAHEITSLETIVTTTVVDSIYIVDTVKIAGTDSVTLVKKLEKLSPKEVSTAQYSFDEDYVKYYTEKVNPLMEAAEKAGWKVYMVTAYAEPAYIESFRHAAQTAYPVYQADDILLKTIIRSNPGVVIWKGGTILKHYHIKRLPSPEKVLEKYK